MKSYVDVGNGKLSSAQSVELKLLNAQIYHSLTQDLIFLSAIPRWSSGPPSPLYNEHCGHASQAYRAASGTLAFAGKFRITFSPLMV